MNAYAWPGNVRELENTVHRAVLLNQSSEIQPESLLFEEPTATSDQSSSNQANDALQVGQTIEEVDRAAVFSSVPIVKSTGGPKVHQD